MQSAALEQHLQHVVNTAHRVQILGEEAAAGLHIGNERRLLRNARKIVQREPDAGLVRDCRDMQARIGRAARRGYRGAGVLEAFLRDEIARQRTAGPKQLHHHPPRFARCGRALLGHCRHGGRARQREPERFRNHGHRVRGELSGAGPERRQADSLELIEFRLQHVARHHRAHRLECIQHGDIAAFPAPGRCGPTIHEHRRQVEAHHRHHHAGQRFIATRESDQRIVGMAAAHGLDAVGDDLARGQRELHARVAHRHRIGHRDRSEVERHPAPLLHRHAGLAREFAKLGVARRHAPVGARDTDERLRDVLIREAEAAQESAVRRAFHAFHGYARRQVFEGSRLGRAARHANAAS